MPLVVARKPKVMTRRRVLSAARIQIKVPGIEAFAKQCKLERSGCFITTRKPLPEGRPVALQVVTVDGKVLFVAEGRVAWAQPPWRIEPHVAGMWIAFSRMSPASKWVLDRLFGPSNKEKEKAPQAPQPAAKPSDPLLEPEHAVEAPKELDPLTRLDEDELLWLRDRNDVPVRPQKQEQSPVVVGIDLGTTYTCAAVVRDHNVQVIHLDDGFRTMPSVVHIKSENEVIVGRTALDQMVTDAKRTIYGSKRLLGRKFGSRPVRDASKYFDYEIVKGEGGDASIQIDGQVYTIPWIGSKILNEVITWVRHQLKDESIDQIVITVPAHYNTRQRQAVLHAARMAGLRPRQIVNEPTAAALAYGIDRGFEQRLLVYDLGGGTFDVAIMELQGNMFEVLATGGDPYLGGNDFDRRIVDWLLAAFKKRTKIDLTNDKVVKLRLRQAAEAAKRELSDENEATIYLPFVAKSGNQPVNLEATITRETLNRLVMDLVDRTLEICERTLMSAQLQRGDIDEVLLVGGQTRMPLVEGKVAAFIGRRPRLGVHPDEAVAVGAAQLAANLDSRDHVDLNDLVGMPIGVALQGKFRPVIRKNTALPADRHISIPTVIDNQRNMSVDVYQGDSGELQGNEYLGTVEVKRLPARPRGAVRVRIHFQVDNHGFLTIYTSHTGSDRRRAVPMVVKDRSERL